MSKLSLSDYTITRQGEIINKKSGRKLKPQPNGKGYLRISIGGKLQFVHRLVAELYIPNPEGKPQVNHKDGNKLNNSVENLEWVTNMENRQHAVKNLLHLTGERCSWSKLTQKDVDFIRSHKDIKIKKIMEMFDVSRSCISAIINNRSWKSN